jgi:hypothetical protein
MRRLVDIFATVEVECKNEQSMVFEATEILADHFSRMDGNPNLISATVSKVGGNVLYDTSRKLIDRDPWCVREAL